MSEGKLLPGKFVWFELVATDAKKAQAFYENLLGWKTVPFPMGNSTYDMIYASDTADSMIGGYTRPRKDGRPSHWISYVSVNDVDATVKAAAANGGSVVDAPFDIPNVGRTARIAGPDGAEICLLKNAKGSDPADGPAQPGRFFWNELHTADPQTALSFCARVLGFSHRPMDMGSGNVYHILSEGGVDRGGVTGHLPKGMQSHWLPYVFVVDPDTTIERARKYGASIPMPPETIPGVGRFGVLQDPTGAVLAVMKPNPMEKQSAA